MEQATPQFRRCTLEEYLALQEQGEVRYEYVEGVAVALATGSKAHDAIKGNLVRGLRAGILTSRQFNSHRYKLVDGDTPVAVEEVAFYAYPDAMVSDDAADRGAYFTWQRPVLIAEVLSPSTMEYDRTTKFAYYQKISDLRHYLLVSQAAWTVEWFRRDEAGQWIYTLLIGPEATLKIPDFGLVLPLRELYEDTGVTLLRVMPGTKEGGRGIL